MAAFLVAATLSVPSLAAASEDPPVMLDLRVNAGETRVALVALRERDVLVEEAALRKAGLIAPGGRRDTFDGVDFVSLASLGEGFRYHLDEEKLLVDLEAPASAFGTTTVDLRRSGPPPGTVYRQDTSVFTNYALSLDDFRVPSLHDETGISYRGTLLFNGLSYVPSRGLVRGLTNWTMDVPARLERLVVGDSFATSGLLGGTLLLGGISYGREFALDPYKSFAPLPAIMGTATSPTTVDVYYDGLLVRRETVPPGTYRLENLPVNAGEGSVTYVARDAFGRSQTFASPYYLASGLLAEGTSDYGAAVGLRRESFSVRSFEYGSFGLLGRYRRGLSDRLTLGGRMDAGTQMVSAGSELAVRAWPGEIGFGAAVSQDGARSGAAFSLTAARLARAFSFGFFLRGMTPAYANASLGATEDRPLLQGGFSAGFPVGRRASVSAGFNTNAMRDDGAAVDSSVRASYRLTDLLGLFLSAARRDDWAGRFDGAHQASYTAMLSMTMAVGAGTSATAAYEQSGDRASGAASLQRSVPAGIGYGYRLQGRVGEASSALVEGDYHARYGAYSASIGQVGTVGSSRLNASGSLVFINGSLFASRPVDRSYGLIQVPGVEGVRGYLNNQEVGRTDPDGDLLLPNLLPYYGNLVRIEDTDIPIAYDVITRSASIAPPYRGGALMRFEVRKFQGIGGRVLVVLADGSRRVPRHGELQLRSGGGPLVSPIGNDGEFYFSDVPQGAYGASVEWEGGTCSFTVTIPRSEEMLLDLGEILCREGLRASGPRASDPDLTGGRELHATGGR